MHPNQPLRYTNLLTGETCVGEDIEYGDAIVERIPRPKNNSSMTSHGKTGWRQWQTIPLRHVVTLSTRTLMTNTVLLQPTVGASS